MAKKRKHYTVKVSYYSEHPLTFTDLNEAFLGVTMTRVEHSPKEKGDRD